MQYQDKKVTVIGLGKTGLSCVDFLRAKHADVRVMDTRNAPAGAEQLDKAIPLHTGSLNQQWLLESDLIVISPGLAVKTPEIQTALQAGVEVVGDIELFCREADKPIVAITGSNGKSTVTTLVAEMAKAAGLSVGMGGNIGIPALSLLNQSHDIYVLELSSFQYYRQAKLKIYDNCQTAVVNGEDPLTLPTTQHPEKQVSFAEHHADYWLKNENQKTYLMARGEVILACDEMKLTGRHNYMNALAAIALAQAAGINLLGIQTALREFGGLEHRFQVAHMANGVRWINDSKATNVGSTVAALTGLQVAGKLYLLLGGDGKGADFSALATLINQPHIYCYCFGRDGKALADLTSQSRLFDTMEQAIAAIRLQLQAGDMVLLSPACASLDQFPCFEARGEEFTRLAQLSSSLS